VLLARGFYACQKTWIPSLLGGVTTLLAIPLYGALCRTMGHRGLALAGSIGITAYGLILAALLAFHLHRQVPSLRTRAFWRFCFLWVSVLVVVGFLAAGVQSLQISQGTRWTAFLELALSFSLAGGVCFVMQRYVFARLTGGP